MVKKLLDDISFHTGISLDQLSFFLKPIGKHNYLYKEIQIPKKTGGFRHVFIPSPELKNVQYYIVESYLKKISVSNYATAYIEGRSIKKNAIIHKNNSSFLFIDLHDFFNSLDFELITNKISKETGIDFDDAKNLMTFCSLNKHFVQGSPSSPFISNIYLKDFDEEVALIVSKLPNGKYTRYSDDITISSSQKIPDTLLKEIEKLLYSYKLKINLKKTHFSSYKNRILVTGVRIKNNNKLTLHTSFKKDLKQRLYFWFKYGKQSKENPEKLLGLMAYLKMIDTNAYNIINTKFEYNGLLATDRIKQSI